MTGQTPGTESNGSYDNTLTGRTRSRIDHRRADPRRHLHCRARRGVESDPTLVVASAVDDVGIPFEISLFDRSSTEKVWFDVPNTSPPQGSIEVE